jgi:hypothetical protein
MDDLAATLRDAGGAAPLQVDAPAGVLYNVTKQPQSDRLIVHLTNYLPHPVEKVVVAVPGKYERVSLLTPDNRGDLPRTVRCEENVTEIEVPRLKIDSLLVFGRDPAKVAP